MIRESNVKMKLLSKYFQAHTILLIALFSNVALADDAAVAATTQNSSQSSAAPANDSQCPCNFSDTARAADFPRITKGTIDCSYSSVILRQAGKPATNEVRNGVILTSLGQGMEGADSMNVWGLSYTIEPPSDANGTIVELCGKNLNGKKNTTHIKNQSQHQACMKDIMQAAAALGLRCEDKS